MKKKQDSHPTFKKIDSQSTLTRSQWVAKKKADRPKFTTTETMEEFLARGGAVKTGETPKYESKGNSRYSFSDKHSGYRANTRRLSRLARKDDAVGMSKSRFVDEQLEKRIKRKIKKEGE